MSALPPIATSIAFLGMSALGQKRTLELPETRQSLPEVSRLLFEISNHLRTIARIDLLVAPHHGEHRDQGLRAVEQWKCDCAHARQQMAFVEGVALFTNLHD